MSGRLKFHRDVSKALILRCDKEIEGNLYSGQNKTGSYSMRPGKRGRKRTASATATAPTRTSPRKHRRLSGNGFVHGAGHHKMQELGKTYRPCRVCVILKKSDLLKGRVKNSKFGCRNCQLRTDRRNGTGGVYVCKEHWDSQLGEDLHQAGWKADQLDGKLSDLVEAS